MPFDPSLPATGAQLQSAVIRDQLQALFNLISAVPAGPTGPEGPTGPQGPQGPAFANVTVDSVTTVSPTTPAGASTWFDGSFVHFSFTIPVGQDGLTGPQGDVSFIQLNDAINTTSASSNGVAFLLPANPSPTAMDVAAKLDELIQALRR